MRRVTYLLPAAMIAAIVVVGFGRPVAGQSPGPKRLAAAERALDQGITNVAAAAALRVADAEVANLVRAGGLKRTKLEIDPNLSWRRHEKLAQYHRGVKVFGAEVLRQTTLSGQPVSIFGSYYPDITISPTPTIVASAAAKLLANAVNGKFAAGATGPELVVLPLDGSYRLTWMARLQTVNGRTRVFIDANTGAPVFTYSDAWTQTALRGPIGTGVNVIGESRKLQTQQLGLNFLAVDLNRGTGGDTTFDIKQNVVRTDVLVDTHNTSQTDIATDPDNVWSDPAVVSAHEYTGLTYDYYRAVHGRSGLDNRDLKIRCLVNPANPVNASNPGGASSLYFNNAFYDGGGFIVFGVGQINGATLSRRNFAGAIDIVAHELTHGVTDFTSDLIYQNESGALNESFSDMMSAAVEFRFQPLGTGLGKSDWSEGEDVSPSLTGLRSFSNPNSLGAPDHYSLRSLSSSDNGGVHTNSNIVNHMYFLAIMGGTNRVSLQTVQGVGFENREQIERVIYRAFTVLMPSNATFSVARAATIQAARDLFPPGSAVEVAITQAWNAVGVS